MSLSDKKITFYIRNIQALNSILPLLKRLPNAVLVSPRNKVYRYYKQLKLPNRGFFYRKFLGRWSSVYKILQHSDVIFSKDISVNDLDQFGALLVHLFFGTYRHIGCNTCQKLADFDLVLTNGPRQTQALLRFQNDYPKLNPQDIGHITFDQFIAKTTTNQQHIKQKLKLPLDKKTIVYLPARRDCGSWVTHAVKLAKEVPEDYNLILRPHPNQVWNSYDEEKTIIEQLNRLFAHKPHRLFDKGRLNYEELLCVADLLISDATSPTEEALFYDIPQIITESFSREQWVADLTQHKIHPDDIENLMQLYEIGPSFAKGNYQHWADCIQDAFEQQTNYQAKRQHYFRDAFGHNQGKAIDNAITAVDQLLTSKQKNT